MRQITTVSIMIAAAILSACSSAHSSPATSSPTPATSPDFGETSVVATPVAAPVSPAAPTPIVAIDAGHGGPNNVGASHHDASGRVDLVEKDLNLDIARRLDVLLRGDGYRTIMIRDGDYGLTPFDRGDFTERVRAESQARADRANEAGADVMVDIHFNGSDDPSQSGTEVYYDPDRSFGDRNRKLAYAIHDALVATLRALPYDVHDRGVKSDAPIGQRFGQAHSFLLGEATGFRPTRMPVALGEALFVSNDADAALLLRDDVRQRIAEAYRDGIEAYFR